MLRGLLTILAAVATVVTLSGGVPFVTLSAASAASAVEAPTALPTTAATAPPETPAPVPLETVASGPKPAATPKEQLREIGRVRAITSFCFRTFLRTSTKRGLLIPALPTRRLPILFRV